MQICPIYSKRMGAHYFLPPLYILIYNCFMINMLIECITTNLLILSSFKNTCTQMGISSHNLPSTSCQSLPTLTQLNTTSVTLAMPTLNFETDLVLKVYTRLQLLKNICSVNTLHFACSILEKSANLMP